MQSETQTQQQHRSINNETETDAPDNAWIGEPILAWTFGANDYPQSVVQVAIAYRIEAAVFHLARIANALESQNDQAAAMSQAMGGLLAPGGGKKR